MADPVPESRPDTTDFGAPIVDGPFADMMDARRVAAEIDGGGIYWENDLWYVHGPAEGTAANAADSDLTTYGKTDD